MAKQIGILTSSDFGGAANSIGAQFKTAFETGYRGVAGTAPTYCNGSPQEAKGKYSANGRVHKQLFRGMNKLNNNADVIVAFGGLVAAFAATDDAEKPFLVLVGRRPDPTDFSLEDNSNFCGGVDLHSTQDNAQRKQALVNMGVSPNLIWLMYNPNSRMGRVEAAEWKRMDPKHKAVRAATVMEDDPDGNDPAEFEFAFARLALKGAKGVIISADPSFSRNRNDLVTQANSAFQQHQIRVCYPTEIYANANPPPANGSSVTIGPPLLAAYQSLGAKAANIVADLDAGRAPTFQGLDPATLIKPMLY